MNATESRPLIVTLQMDQDTFQIFDKLRQQHFPPERNVVPAHVTLFHALPGEEEPAVSATLRRVCQETRPLTISFPGVRFFGHGVAIEVEGAGLLAVRRRLASVWQPWLSAQDRQPFRPHITVQNKVSPTEARALFEHLRPSWQPFAGRGEGLHLWRYLGGPWEPVQAFAFERDGA